MTRSPALLLLLVPAVLAAQEPPAPPSAAAQIAAAVAPLPEEFRATATVLGYTGPGTTLSPLRRTDGPFVCLADDPADAVFHVACYHRSMEPFMERGRQLRAQGRAEEVDTVRYAEARAGALRLPDRPAALYSLTGAVDSVSVRDGVVSGARRLYVVYIPYATAESTGLPTRPAPDAPWLMFPGTPKAHIMFIPSM